MKEIWKDVNGYEGFYQVSNLGRVKSLDRIVKNKGLIKKESFIKKGRILKQRTSKSKGLITGYYRVLLTKEKVGKNFCVHKLVAEAFIPNPENKPQVDHINTIISDNRVENLKWVTSKENNRNDITMKKKSKYKINGKSAVQAAKENGVNTMTFYSRIRKGIPIEEAVLNIKY